MTKKDLQKVEQIVERVLHDMLYEPSSLAVQEDDDETVIPMHIIDIIEDYMGEPIMFMGIS